MRVDLEGFAARTGADRGVLIVAPHPDDECAGPGGLAALCAQAGIEIGVVVVTDGGASHPNSRAWPRGRLAARRQEETRAALATLGVRAEPVFLGLPDAGTPSLPGTARAEACARLRAEVEARRPGLVVTTWRREPHCDHRFAYDLAVGAIADTGSRLAEYLVWTDLIGAPGDAPASGEVERLDLDISSVQARKADALRAHRSQLGLVVDDDPDGFVLSEAQLVALTGPVETYLM